MPRLYKYPAATIKHRFSTIRWHKAVCDLSDNQKSYVSKYELDNLLNIHPHLMVPVPILQWIADHLNCNGTGVFRKGTNIIHLRKEMVIQVFGICSGSMPFPVDSTDEEVVTRVLQLRAQYLGAGEKNIPVDTIVTMMKNDEIEEGFIQSFMFLFISTVFCPTTKNYANWKLLYGLHDITKLKTFDLAQLCIDHLNKEIDNFSTKLLNRTKIPLNNSIFVGGCLPLAAIVYLDFVDFIKASQQGKINYGVPRMAHVQNEDFDYLASVDRNRASKKPFALGLLPMRDISTTPYSARAIVLAEEKWSKVPRAFHNQEDVAPKYNDVASTSNNNPEILNIISQVVAKHDETWKRIHEQHVQKMYAELKDTVMSFQRNSNRLFKNAGTSTTDPIVLLSASSNRNNMSEPVNTNNHPVQTSSDPIRSFLFEDNLGVSPSPHVSLSHANIDIQVEVPTGITKEVSLSKQLQEIVETPSVGNKGTVPEPLQTEHSNEEQIKDAIVTPSMPVLKPLDPVDTGRDTEPTCQIPEEAEKFHHVNTDTVNFQETLLSGNSVNFQDLIEQFTEQVQLVSEVESATVSVLKEIIPQLRQVVAYKLAKSDINEEEFEGHKEDVSTKKRKKRR